MDLTDLRNAFARLKSLTTERRALRMRLLVGRKRISDEIDDGCSCSLLTWSSD